MWGNAEGTPYSARREPKLFSKIAPHLPHRPTKIFPQTVRKELVWVFVLCLFHTVSAAESCLCAGGALVGPDLAACVPSNTIEATKRRHFCSPRRGITSGVCLPYRVLAGNVKRTCTLPLDVPMFARPRRHVPRAAVYCPRPINRTCKLALQLRAHSACVAGPRPTYISPPSLPTHTPTGRNHHLARLRMSGGMAILWRAGVRPFSIEPVAGCKFSGHCFGFPAATRRE